MHAYRSRAGRLPLALTATLATLMLAVLGACADDTTAPTFSAPLRPNAAAGDVYLVTKTADNGEIGSLRWALKFTTGGETIRFDPSLAGQTVVVDSTIYIYKPVTIEGPAGAGITISGGGKTRMFQANFTGTLTLRNLSVTGGYSVTTVGPVLYAEADLVVENSVFYGNHGPAGTVLYAGNITLTNSTVSDNTASGVNGLQQYGAVQGDTVLVVNSTIANNGDAGVATTAGRITLRNSILANNYRDNCVRLLSSASLVREGKNVSDDDKCGGPSEIIIADPKLAPLADNGGPTKTRALLAGSPAINTGTNCSVTVDQRYMARDAQCDLGAFEFADFTAVTVTIDPSSIVKQSTGWAVLTGTVRCSRAETFSLAIDLEQAQKSGRTTSDVHAAALVPVQCSTTPRMWSASMVLTEGAFQNGTASATTQIVDAEPWVAPATASGAVKLFRSK
jgi:hypothetical protein